MHRNQSVNVHQFAMVPHADIPRSSFRIQKTHKTTMDSGVLVPIWVDEILPGDSFNLNATIFARMATPLFPIMDNAYFETFFFFVPYRLVWSNWEKFMGQQDNPGDSTSFSIPQITSPTGGWATNSLEDHLGLPCVGQILAGNTVTHSALPMRAYNLIWNKWFRDENLQNSVPTPVSDGPDTPAQYGLWRRGKRHDYFTSCLPWTQKGASVSIPLGTTAPVVATTPHAVPTFWGSVANASRGSLTANTAGTAVGTQLAGNTADLLGWNSTALMTDLSAATAATINQLRQSFQVQKLLERDARGGTRYTEIVRSHFGVISPDARLQRPEYLGGGSTPVNVSPIAQTSGTAPVGDGTPQGHLSAIGTVLGRNHGFHQGFTEHGIVIGLASVRADLTYQQGLRKMWSRKTRYDFYFPVFAMLGEQAVLNKEIYCIGGTGGVTTQDDAVFGYQERWAEYRYNPSEITGEFKSYFTAPLDGWHLAQFFTTLPTLNATFIEDRPPFPRILAVGAEALGQEFIVDMFFDVKAARPLPMYSVPGMIDHF